MGHLIWVAVQWTIGIALFCAIAFVLPYALWVLSGGGLDTWDYPLRSKIVLALATLWALFFLIGGILFLVHLDSEDQKAAHSWRGGTGPATSCDFETRQVTYIVGKVPVTHNETWTVCVDGGR